MNNFILVVDDDQDVREAMAAYLQSDGLKTLEARSGNQALSMIKSNKDIIFVISDVRMADGNGVYLLDEIRKIDPTLPYIVLVSGQSDITREEVLKKGALEYFTKPPDMDAIIALIKKTINFKGVG